MIRNRFAAMTVMIVASVAAVLSAVPARAAVSRPRLAVTVSAPTTVVDDRTSGHPTTLAYKVEVVNTGSRVAHNVAVVDVLPDGLTADGGFSSTTLTVGNVPAGFHWHGVIRTLLDSSKVHGAKVSNEVLAVSTDAYPVFSAPVTTRVTAISAVTISR